MEPHRTYTFLNLYGDLFSFVIAATGQELSIDSIDLLESLHLHNTSHQGVTETPGPQRLKPAYSLQGE
jgi:hypothetical protein